MVFNERERGGEREWDRGKMEETRRKGDSETDYEGCMCVPMWEFYTKRVRRNNFHISYKSVMRLFEPLIACPYYHTVYTQRINMKSTRFNRHDKFTYKSLNTC